MEENAVDNMEVATPATGKQKVENESSVEERVSPTKKKKKELDNLRRALLLTDEDDVSSNEQGSET